jgi:hypothetical protein
MNWADSSQKISMANKYTKCSVSLAIKKMQIKSTLRFHLITDWQSRKQIATNDDKDAGWRVGGKVNWCNLYGNQYGGSSENCRHDLMTPPCRS